MIWVKMWRITPWSEIIDFIILLLREQESNFLFCFLQRKYKLRSHSRLEAEDKNLLVFLFFLMLYFNWIHSHNLITVSEQKNSIQIIFDSQFKLQYFFIYFPITFKFKESGLFNVYYHCYKINFMIRNNLRASTISFSLRNFIPTRIWEVNKN